MHDFLAAGRGRQIHCAGEKRQRPRDAQGLARGASRTRQDAGEGDVVSLARGE